MFVHKIVDRPVGQEVVEAGAELVARIAGKGYGLEVGDGYLGKAVVFKRGLKQVGDAVFEMLDRPGFDIFGLETGGALAAVERPVLIGEVALVDFGQHGL